jgi:hypothetical protein
MINKERKQIAFVFHSGFIISFVLSSAHLRAQLSTPVHTCDQLNLAIPRDCAAK